MLLLLESFIKTTNVYHIYFWFFSLVSVCFPCESPLAQNNKTLRIKRATYTKFLFLFLPFCSLALILKIYVFIWFNIPLFIFFLFCKSKLYINKKTILVLLTSSFFLSLSLSRLSLIPKFPWTYNSSFNIYFLFNREQQQHRTL